MGGVGQGISRHQAMMEVGGDDFRGGFGVCHPAEGAGQVQCLLAMRQFALGQLDQDVFADDQLVLGAMEIPPLLRPFSPGDYRRSGCTPSWRRRASRFPASTRGCGASTCRPRPGSPATRRSGSLEGKERGGAVPRKGRPAKKAASGTAHHIAAALGLSRGASRLTAVISGRLLCCGSCF